MLVVVKTPLTEFTVSGNEIPIGVIQDIEKRFGADSIETRSEGYENATDMQWYREAKAQATPGDHLRNYRKNVFHLTQKMFAKKIGIATQTVSNMETGVRPISRQMAKRLGEFFGTDSGKFI